MPKKVDYRVRPVTRYVVTRWEDGDNSCGSEQRGTFDNFQTAHEVAYALCKAEHDASDAAIDSAEFMYPLIPWWQSYGLTQASEASLAIAVMNCIEQTKSYAGQDELLESVTRQLLAAASELKDSWLRSSKDA